MSTVDSRLKFLPYGMVLHLQSLLADRQVDEFEREHVVSALDADRTMSKAQKQEVARLSETWAAHDRDVDT